MRHQILLSGLLGLLLLAGCVPTRSAAEMKKIQTTKGFLTESLYYAGSGSRHHYFEQEVLLDRWWWVPGRESDGQDSYRVRRSELEVPRALLFKRSSYQGKDDPQRVKVRISDGPPFRMEERVRGKVRLRQAQVVKKGEPPEDNAPAPPGFHLPALQTTPAPIPPRP